MSNSLEIFSQTTNLEKVSAALIQHPYLGVSNEDEKVNFPNWPIFRLYILFIYVFYFGTYYFLCVVYLIFVFFRIYFALFAL